MAKGEFDFGSGLTPVQGVCVMQCMDEEGQLRIQVAQYGDVHTYQAVGLLTGALDVVRGQLKDSFGGHVMRRQEVWEPTYKEKEALFEVFLMGWREAEQGRPMRRGHNLDTLSQKHYRDGWSAKHAEMLLKAILPDD